MKLHVIGSSSAGNCYLFTDNGGNTLIVECGVRFEIIKRALDFDLSRVAGVCVTHEHGDHSKGVAGAVNAGLDVWATAGTLRAFGYKSYRFNPMKIGQAYHIGPFAVIAFDTHHNTTEPCGFLIRHPEMGTTLFLTDTTYCDYRFPGLTNIIIEANYSEDIIDRTLSDKKFLRDRVINDHMSVETCISTLQANDLRKVNNIVLIHLSDRNSDAKQFQQMIESATCKTVTVATAGLTINNFNVTPF
ncbi:MBL fold metallo-hydrolase [Parapedobacter indicus]|uniref:Phosphoribosyl 1,2-cyclic phosphodiesterase n=1 Tax=Parapedobacter indicus TaxID=1477437 RepID=A0A1I3E0C4_9SPHI|nr:MBL fold metallo-hydrolase [Parapedobacter indicus]PPL04917.1 phosphoribosyl 1,2-cyclic phosphodiesterase [Parapedobacter indicus]SFH92427.1 Phosphoribosyl 1,2-cyclic phosphodiesterase [Parapedobacter indicus]